MEEISGHSLTVVCEKAVEVLKIKESQEYYHSWTLQIKWRRDLPCPTQSDHIANKIDLRFGEKPDSGNWGGEISKPFHRERKERLEIYIQWVFVIHSNCFIKLPTELADKQSVLLEEIQVRFPWASNHIFFTGSINNFILYTFV